MVILIDIDGVVCEYDFPKITKKHFGVAIPNKAIYTYSIEDSLGVASSDVVRMFEKECFSKPVFALGAIDTLKGFLSAGHQVSIYSNRLHFMTQDELETWLGKYKIPYSNICTNQSLPSYVHVYVDDSPAKLMAVEKVVEVKRLLLFDAPWNKACLNITGRMERVKGWKQVRKVVNG